MATLFARMPTWDVRLPAMVVSVVFSLIVIAGHPVLNDDAFSYLKAAERFTRDGLGAMLADYGWYSYSVLIASVHAVLPLDLIQSAHLLNILSFALLVWAFITVASEFDESRETPWFAALVILCLPTLNDMRPILIRDSAYWAFCLLALLQLIRFNRQGRFIHAVGWVLAMTAAVLFRLEGLIIFAVSPFALLLPSGHDLSARARLTATLLLLMAGGFLAVLGLFLAAGTNLIDIFSYAYRWYLPLLADYTATIHGAATGDALSEHISTQLLPFTGKGVVVLWIGYLYAVVANLVAAVGAVPCLLLAYSAYRCPPGCKWPWLGYFASALLALVVFVSIMQFMRPRYTVMAALLLLVFLPQSLLRLMRLAKDSGREKRFRTILAFGVFYFIVDSLISFGYSKQYILDAADWSRANIPPGSAVQTNNFALAYHSGLVSDYDTVDVDPLTSLKALADKDFLVLDLAHDDDQARTEVQTLAGLDEVARFANKRDDAIVVYRLTR